MPVVLPGYDQHKCQQIIQKVCRLVLFLTNLLSFWCFYVESLFINPITCIFFYHIIHLLVSILYTYSSSQINECQNKCKLYYRPEVNNYYFVFIELN